MARKVFVNSLRGLVPRARRLGSLLLTSWLPLSLGFTSLPMPRATALPLSPGDRVEVSIPDEKYFARVYEVNQDGNLEIPYLGNLSVIGLEPSAAAQKLSTALIANEYFPPNALKLSLQVLLWSPIEVGISGEVFAPGRVTINDIAEDDRVRILTGNTQPITGDNPARRRLTDALQTAGGITPTADIRNIRIVRGRREKTVDLTGLFSGAPIENVPLMAGDQIIVPTANRFQPELVRPSKITLPGIKIFVSNLTTPAGSNSTAAISNRQEGINFPYGGRFSQAVIATNCVGGTKSTNANRQAILLRVNPKTGRTAYLERSVEELIRTSQTEAENPLLMPRDSVACYDSTITNRRDVLRTVSDTLNPIKLILDFIF